MNNLRGIVPIVATPFDDHGKVDYESIRTQLRYIKAVGCDGATLFGIASEYYKLSDEESLKMIDVMVDECKNIGLPSVVSCTPHSTYSAIERARYIEQSGADVMMLLPPFFLKPGGDELFNHIKEVVSSVKIPVMLQYAPEQTGVGIPSSVLRSLAEQESNLKYFKVECKPAGPYISSLLEGTSGDFSVFAGNAGYQMLETFDRGAAGAMPGSSMAELYVAIYDAYRSGDREKAVELHNSLLPILNHIRQNVEMIIHYEKLILYRNGIISTPVCRHPEFAADGEMDKLFEFYYSAVRPLLKKTTKDVSFSRRNK